MWKVRVSLGRVANGSGRKHIVKAKAIEGLKAASGLWNIRSLRMWVHLPLYELKGRARNMSPKHFKVRELYGFEC